MAQQGFEEDLLRRWFPANAEKTSTPLTENDICGIADVLTRCARERWSRVPRLYGILRKIGQLEAIDAFIDAEITDVYFPFTKNTLPEALRDHSARLQFLELQHLVYNTEALNLERHARHGHFGDPTEVPLKKVGELGKGGYGYVDRVVSTISHQEYARKLILRGRTFKKDKQVLKDFTKELSNLKRLSHRHLVELVGSYTDKKFVAIVMLPVADTNLQTFMERPDLDERSRSFLRPFFGCLTSALSYLHDHQIRHKDIKPSNVLIKNDQVYFTDFGTSLDWSGRDNSTTVTAAPTTPRYCAPEVMAYLKRNSAADIWSFGCVFLEMWTVLKFRTIKDLRAHMGEQGTGIEAYHSNPEAIASWIALLQRLPGPSSDLIPADWIVNMLHQKPQARWNIHTLDNYITEASIESSIQHTFKGICCLDLEDETSEDSQSSIEDSESQLTPEECPRDAPSFTILEEAPQVRKYRSPVLGNTYITSVVLNDLDGDTGLSRSHLSQHDAESPSSASENTDSGVQRPARVHINATGNYSDNANDEDDEPTRIVSSFPDSVLDTNHESSVGEERAPEVPESSPSSSDESYMSAPPYRSPAVNLTSVELHQLEVTQTTSNQILCLRTSADDTDLIPRSRSPVRRLAERSIKYTEEVLSKIPPETNTMRFFDEHARDCSDCYNPLGIYLGNRQLCEAGYQLAHDVLESICRFDGKIFGTTKHQYICEPNAIRPIFRVEQSPSLGIPSKYIQVKSLLKAVERSMLNRSPALLKDGLPYSEVSPRQLGYFWAALHMCVICKRPLGRRNKESASINALSCTHQVHKSCKMGLEGLGCPNERYCSLCPESTPVIQKPQGIRSSALSSIDTPRGNSSKNRDVGDSASQGDVGTSSARKYNPKARPKINSTQDWQRYPTHRVQGRENTVLDLSGSYYFARQPASSYHPVYEPAQYQSVPLEAEGHHFLPSRNPFAPNLDLGMRRAEPEYVPIYDPEPRSSIPRRLAAQLTPFQEHLRQVIPGPGRTREAPEYLPIFDPDTSRPRRATVQPTRTQKDPRNVSPIGAAPRAVRPSRYSSPVGQRRLPLPRADQARDESEDSWELGSSTVDEYTDDDSDHVAVVLPYYQSQSNKVIDVAAMSMAATCGYESPDTGFSAHRDQRARYPNTHSYSANSVSSGSEPREQPRVMVHGRRSAENLGRPDARYNSSRQEPKLEYWQEEDYESDQAIAGGSEPESKLAPGEIHFYSDVSGQGQLQVGGPKKSSRDEKTTRRPKEKIERAKQKEESERAKQARDRFLVSKFGEPKKKKKRQLRDVIFGQ